jgi:hypothetical protein
MNTPAQIAQQVRSICDLLHQYQGMGARQRKRIETPGFYNSFARMILDGATPQLAGNLFNLVRLRSIHGAEFLSIVPVMRAVRPTRKLQAFVGHRFTDAVTPNLRHNLAILFQGYGIRPKYSDSDSPNGPVFQTIVDRIRKCDFAVFDDRETETRPNTLIEIGAAIALDKPHFYFNYQNKRTIMIGKRRERISTASDLAGMLYMPYQEYDALFREFAVRLPLFLLDRGLAEVVESKAMDGE